MLKKENLKNLEDEMERLIYQLGLLDPTSTEYIEVENRLNALSDLTNKIYESKHKNNYVIKFGEIAVKALAVAAPAYIALMGLWYESDGKIFAGDVLRGIMKDTPRQLFKKDNMD